MYSFFWLYSFHTALQYEFVSLKVDVEWRKQNEGTIKSTIAYFSHERNVFRMSIWNKQLVTKTLHLLLRNWQNDYTSGCDFVFFTSHTLSLSLCLSRFESEGGFEPTLEISTYKILRKRMVFSPILNECK